MSILIKITQSKKDTKVNSIDPLNASLPMFMQKVASKIVTNMKTDEYDMYDYKAMVNKCNHLTNDQQGKLLNLFRKYKDLFSGNLESVPIPPMEIKLREKVKPFHSQVYTIPQVYM